MSLKKALKLKNTLLFRLTALYALAFVAVSLVSFLIFYFYVYSVSMERMDDELLWVTSMPCAVIGARLAHRLPAAELKKAFALFIVCVGVYLIMD